jgi:large subunit ribosomal protein L30
MYVIIRLKGGVNTRAEIKDTMRMLRLNQINHAVVVEDTPNYRGMIKVAKDYVAFGTIDAPTLAIMLEHRGKLVGGDKLTDEYVAKNSTYKSISEFAEAVVAGKAKLSDMPALHPVFRLRPPRKGHAGIKRTCQQGGALGNYGEDINALVEKMR